MDGETALWHVADEWLSRAVGILDVFHSEDLGAGSRAAAGALLQQGILPAGLVAVPDSLTVGILDSDELPQRSPGRVKARRFVSVASVRDELSAAAWQRVEMMMVAPM